MSLQSHDNRIKKNFLGEHVFRMVLTDLLFQSYPDSAVNELDKRRENLKLPPLAKTISSQIGLDEYVSRWTDSGFAFSSAQWFFALVGALYQSADFSEMREFVCRHLADTELNSGTCPPQISWPTSQDWMSQALSFRTSQEVMRRRRLAFLGDAVQSVVLAQMLMKKYPDVDMKTIAYNFDIMRSAAVQAKIARETELAETMKVNYPVDSEYSTCMEAVIGALYLEKGMEAAEDFIHTHWLSRLTSLQAVPAPMHSRKPDEQQPANTIVPNTLQSIAQIAKMDKNRS